MNKKLKKLLIFIILLITFCVVLFRVIKIQDIVLKQIYPITYKEFVEKYADKYDVDTLLVFAIIKAESNYNPNIISSSGAIGLMQLMEETAEETAKKMNYNYSIKECLYNPETNIMLGVKYFSELKELYEGNIPLALTAYNAGRGNLEKWINSGIIKEDGSNIEDIPFKETNNYVRKILRDYKIYIYLYKN